MQHKVLCLVAICLASLAAPAQTFPPGINHENLVTGFSGPVGLGFLSMTNGDMRFLVAEQSGRVQVAMPNGMKRVIGNVTGINTSGNERGLLGVVVDPGWPSRPYAYFHLTSTSGDVRIIRHTITGDVAVQNSLNINLGDRREILTGMPDTRFNHNGGSVRFGPDGMLYASLGDDAANSCDAQSRTGGRGIIFRMDVANVPAGAGAAPSIASITPATGNPFVGQANYAPLVYSLGLRNPFRINIDPLNGDIVIADVGQNAFEEMSLATGPGQNFGWPIFEGNSPFSGSCPLNGTHTAPIVAVSHSEGWISIMSFGGRYRNVPGGSRNLGPQYEGQILYGDFFSGQIRRLEFNGSTWVNPAPVSGQPSATNWATGMGGLADAVIGPDGAIYYADLTGNLIGRVSGDPNAATLTVLSGDGEPANAGQALATPVRVRLSTLTGTPQAGATITWSVTGSASLSATTTQTDANGETEVMATMAQTFSAAPVITASASPTTTAQIRPIWRGLSVTRASSFVIVTVRHSQPLSPVSLFVDLPVATPYFGTPFGDIWTSAFSVPSTAIVFDGLGIFGPPQPFQTGASSSWTQLFNVTPPTGGLQVLMQSVAVDSARAGTPAEIAISNPVTVTLP